VACEQGGDSGGVTAADASGATVAFTPPISILMTRAIDPNALVLTVEVDGDSVPVERIDGRWLAQVEVARGQSIEVTVTWSELFGGSSLKLAALTKPVTVAPTATGVDVTFTSSEFDTSSTADLDVDNDGRSNLAERRADTDPRDPTDPGEPVTDVVVPLEINLPEALASADQSVQEAVDITVVVGSMIIDMTRDGSVWRGSALAPQQSDSFVSVEVFESAAKDLRLARYGRSRTSGDGNLIVVNPGDYDVTDDQDNDGVSNIVELANGTDPRYHRLTMPPVRR